MTEFIHKFAYSTLLLRVIRYHDYLIFGWLGTGELNDFATILICYCVVFEHFHLVAQKT